MQEEIGGFSFKFMVYCSYASTVFKILFLVCEF